MKTATERAEMLRSAGEQNRLKQQEIDNKLANQTETITRLTKEKRLFEYESRELHQFLTEYQTKSHIDRATSKLNGNERTFRC